MARRIDDKQMKLTFAQSHLAGRATTCALGIEMIDPNDFESLESFKTRLKRTFEPPRAEFRSRSELLKLKQGERDVHAYSKHIRLLASSITANSVHEHKLITVFMQGITVPPVRINLSCDTGGLKRKTGSCYLDLLLPIETTRYWRSRTNGSILF